MDIDIVVLGPVELHVRGRLELSGAAKVVHLLAALALDAGKAVPLETLSRRIWDDVLPGKPSASLHAYATRLRRRLGDERLVQQQAHAYTLDVPPHAVDYHRFEHLVVQARSLASSGDDTQALALLRRAEALWRGAPLTGFTGLWAQQVRRGLAERRLAATLFRIEIELRAGHFAGLMEELSGLLDRHPTDETVVRHFMIAAHGNGRQSDALRAYESVRRRLRQFGTEPGEALTQVYRRILDQVPAGELVTPAPRAGSAAPAPQNLPAHSKLLVGRAQELRALRNAGASVVAFQAISGMAGVGKTLLALHAARDLADQYPDGQVHINLGAHASRRPLSPEAALTALLRTFGVPVKALPHDLDGLVTLWRTVLGTRRAVIVLDDAADAAQIQPLLPGDSPSLVLITSRRRLTGIPGIHHVFIDVLTPADAQSLLTERAGLAPGRASEDIAALARLCGNLPLALELAAARLRSHPAWTVGHLVQRMSQDSDRLAEIRDGRSEIASVFAFSYQDLTAEEQRVFRLLALHRSHTFDIYATAALVGLPLATTERVLESLLDAHLLQEPAADRYEFHDLIAVYAQSLMLYDPHSVRERALEALTTFHLYAVAAADRLLHPRRRHLVLPSPPATLRLPEWSGPQQAKAWLLAEIGAVIDAEARLREGGDHERAAYLADVAGSFLDAEGLWGPAATMHTYAARYWDEVGDRSAQAHALLALASVQSQAGRYEEAERNSHRALASARAVADEDAEAEALRSLWLVCWNLGRLKESQIHQQQALDIRLRSGDVWQIARARNNLGISLFQLGQHASAMECFATALDGFVRAGDPRGEAQALNNLGDLHHHMGQEGQARMALSRSLDLTTEFGSRAEKAILQLNLANTMQEPGDLERTLNLYREALVAFRHIGDKRNETVTLNAIGTALHRAGQHAEASAHHTVALALAREIGAAQEEVQALRGLGSAEFSSGRGDSGVQQLTEALALAERIGASEEEARAHMALADLHLAADRRGEAVRHLWRAHDRFLALNEAESAALLARLRDLAEPA
ncbi:AfsR/SARP family transcriptional regulator [Actinacidiphila acididurans]|uniref:Tetratricopeptide repeat protein n=1 Tax=Actinacidiphila acididurans TaxID=2784346 RepID=A0ABS2U0B6_9ACTN|nr:BTAD domain-containing putative transcriptional regulator [Actinacidiphila acididurans]MBM9508651.1 tetratricopeptide repeat protein [Actinacidiphila acididurans]